jgi:UrcA family protein
MLAAAVATALTLAVAPVAMAADGQVSWKGLDLTTDAGRTELDGRIDTAAHEICNTGAMTGSRVDHGPSRTCLADARTEIRAQLAKRLPATAFASAKLAGGPNSEAR